MTDEDKILIIVNCLEKFWQVDHGWSVAEESPLCSTCPAHNLFDDGSYMYRCERGCSGTFDDSIINTVEKYPSFFYCITDRMFDVIMSRNYKEDTRDKP